MDDQASSSFVGDIPGHYDRDLGPVLFEEFAADMAARVAAHRPTRVLELAAGTGIVTRRLRDLLAPDADLTATDLNDAMLDVARAKFRPGERIGFQPADATALPFADGAFDAALCQFGVMFFPDKDASHREAHRVLAPGGRYTLSVWDSHRQNTYARLVHEVISGFFAADPPQFYRVPFGYHSLDAVKDGLTQAGFAGIEVAVLTRDKAVADLPAFTRGLVHGNPLVDQIRSRGEVDPDRVVRAIADALRRDFGSDPCRIPLHTITFSARKP